MDDYSDREVYDPGDWRQTYLDEIEEEESELRVESGDNTAVFSSNFLCEHFMEFFGPNPPLCSCYYILLVVVLNIT